MKRIVEPGEGPPDPALLRRLEFRDLGDALNRGWDDFVSFPTFSIMIALIYPIVGLLLARVLHGYSFLPLLFPIAAGFTLLGPFAAVIFYDFSRRRALGQSSDEFSPWEMTSSPSRTGIVVLGSLLALLFLVWLAASQTIYNSFYGFAPVSSMVDFIAQVATTSRGRTFLILICGTGFIFCISVVSFPMLLDRKASATDAMLTSYRVIAKSPMVLLGWGCTVALLLLAGSVPAFLGLAIAVPVLGHATWHLYRRAVP
ncbi:MAG TPA: DUF2189 domain-containing protein [Candidatus Sulfotelmatobacter sp.]|nr:DUF2189 domain-containing protein [Candidatus Sulfotelmatobacter sp.]